MSRNLQWLENGHIWQTKQTLIIATYSWSSITQTWRGRGKFWISEFLELLRFELSRFSEWILDNYVCNLTKKKLHDRTVQYLTCLMTVIQNNPTYLMAHITQLHTEFEKHCDIYLLVCNTVKRKIQKKYIAHVELCLLVYY